MHKSSDNLLKQISLKTNKHARQPAKPIAKRKPLATGGPIKKRRSVKKNDIMEMIYPSYEKSFKQAVTSMKKTLSAKPREDKKELTVVSEKKEEDEEDVKPPPPLP